MIYINVWFFLKRDIIFILGNFIIEICRVIMFFYIYFSIIRFKKDRLLDYNIFRCFLSLLFIELFFDFNFVRVFKDNLIIFFRIF